MKKFFCTFLCIFILVNSIPSLSYANGVTPYVPGGSTSIIQDVAHLIGNEYITWGADQLTNVATGRIETGVIHVGDDVQLLGLGEDKKSVVTGVEMFRKLLDEGQAGDNVGLLLRGIDNGRTRQGRRQREKRYNRYSPSFMGIG